MGMFKDLKGMVDVARSDELKDLRKTARAQPRTRMMDTLRAGNAALAQTTAMSGALTDGVAGQARIDSVIPTGQYINQTPVLAFELTITVPGRETYSAQHTQMVSPLALASFQPGATVPVRVAVDDPTSIYVGA